jgi:hypothetical protein
MRRGRRLPRRALLGFALAFGFEVFYLLRESPGTVGEKNHQTDVRARRETRRITEDQKKLLSSSPWNITNTASDTAYLAHCNLTQIDINKVRVFQAGITKVTGIVVEDVDDLALQSLELYARGEKVCNFSNYRPVPNGIDDRATLEIMSRISSPPPDEVRIVYCISAFADFTQLQELVDVIVLPQHLIIIHLDKRTNTDFVAATQTLVETYPDNVLLLHYGNIVYPSDSISHIFLEIMRYITIDFAFEYDYWINLGSSAYPLFSDVNIARFLKSEKPRVRIGTMVHEDAAKFCRAQSSSMGLIWNSKKRHVNLWKTAESYDVFFRKTSLPSSGAFQPDGQKHCKYKTNSGNTAAFNIAAVRDLLESGSAMEFLSRFKLTGEQTKTSSSTLFCSALLLLS